jgi:hypothetical protein
MLLSSKERIGLFTSSCFQLLEKDVFFMLLMEFWFCNSKSLGTLEQVSLAFYGIAASTIVTQFH